MPQRTSLSIDLLPEEEVLLRRVDFSGDGEYGESAAEAVTLLYKQLQRRGAIPEVRLRWFEDADLNIGGHGSSRRQILERNAGGCDEALCHWDFAIHYLSYFVFGPQLPQNIIDGYQEERRRCPGRKDKIARLSDYTRNVARVFDLGADSDIGEEFFKLALELDEHLPEIARTVRDAARKAAL